MIAAGRGAEAERAVAELGRALTAAGLRLPGLEVDPLVWETANGAERLVELGAVAPEFVWRLATVVRRGTPAPARRRVADGADLAPGTMAYPPCRCPRCRERRSEDPAG